MRILNTARPSPFRDVYMALCFEFALCRMPTTRLTCNLGGFYELVNDRETLRHIRRNMDRATRHVGLMGWIMVDTQSLELRLDLKMRERRMFG